MFPEPKPITAEEERARQRQHTQPNPTPASAPIQGAPSKNVEIKMVYIAESEFQKLRWYQEYFHLIAIAAPIVAFVLGIAFGLSGRR